MNKNNILGIMLILILITACETTDKKKPVYSSNKQTTESINEIETLLAKNEFEKSNKEDIKIIEKKIKELENLVKNNKLLEARVYGYYGQLGLIREDINSTKKYINAIERINNKEELLYILKAKIEKDDDLKKQILLKGIKNLDNSNKIKVYLADLYFNSGFFKDAIVLFDDSLPKLPYIYQTHYKKIRNLSFELANQPPKQIESVKIFLHDEITISDMLEITISETTLLNEYLEQKNSLQETLNKLINNNFFPNHIGNLSLNQVVQKKDIACFLAGIIINKENDFDIINKYKNDYNYSRHVDSVKNPFKDVKISDYYFGCAMLLLEREILDLPDGLNFFPLKSVSGLELYKILKKLEKFY